MTEPKKDWHSRDWHLDKTISVGHLISTAAIIVSVFVWALTIDSRVSRNEAAIRHVLERTDEIKQETREDYKEISRKLDEINRYLRATQK